MIPSQELKILVSVVRFHLWAPFLIFRNYLKGDVRNFLTVFILSDVRNFLNVFILRNRLTIKNKACRKKTILKLIPESKKEP